MKISYYPVSGQRLPGVTTILDVGLGSPQFLIDWAVKQGALKLLKTWKEKGGALNQYDAVAVAKSARFDVLKEAQARGIAVHSYAEWFLDNKAHGQTFDSLYEPYYNVLAEWLGHNTITPIFQERFVVNLEAEYAGRLDLYAEYQGKKWLLDFKTSNTKSHTHGLQLQAYAECLRQQGFQVEGTACIYVHPVNKVMTCEFQEYNETFEMFLTVKKVFDWKIMREQQIEWNERMKPKEVEAELLLTKPPETNGSAKT